MGKPTLEVTFGPEEGGKLVVQPIAPGVEGADDATQLALRLKIKNKHGSALKLKQVDLTVTGQATKSFGPTKAEPGFINMADGDSVPWYTSKDNYFVLARPAPAQIEIAVWCEDLTEPHKLDPIALTEHVHPEGGFLFPGFDDDLDDGEAWWGRSAAHNSGGGKQLFAHDLVVVAYNGTKFSSLKPNEPENENSTRRIWHKRVRAMADGTVVAVVDGAPTNETPGQHPSDFDNIIGGGSGNHFDIDHGGGVTVRYAHFDDQDFNPDGLTNGSPVTAGAMLGRVGNTGRSDGPHLHIAATRNDVAWPLVFRDSWALDSTAADPATLQGDWVQLNGEGLPLAKSLVRPSAALDVSRVVKPGKDYWRIDPMARLLAYHVYVRLKKPNPPWEVARDALAEITEGLTRTQRTAIAKELRALASQLGSIKVSEVRQRDAHGEPLER